MQWRTAMRKGQGEETDERLFLGIETMGSVMKQLESSPVFTDMIAKVADIPILGVAVGTRMTLVVQSSSATIVLCWGSLD